MTGARVRVARTVTHAPRSAPDDADLTRAECTAAAIRKAFPLPPSGAFKDLLAAIDDLPSLNRP